MSQNYRWVLTHAEADTGHYARADQQPGHRSMCGEATIGPDWNGPVDEYDRPAGVLACGPCVVEKMADAGQIKLVRTTGRRMIPAG
jgi:hypothetical protein